MQLRAEVTAFLELWLEVTVFSKGNPAANTDTANFSF